MKILKLPNNTLIQVKGQNFYLANQDPRYKFLEKEVSDEEAHRILSFQFLKDIDPNFDVSDHQMTFCGIPFPSAIVARYLKDEIEEDTFRSLINGWKNLTYSVDNAETLNELQTFLDNNFPVVPNGLVYLTNGNIPKFDNLPIIISRGDPNIFEGKSINDFIKSYFPQATNKFVKKFIKRAFKNGERMDLSSLLFAPFVELFGYDKVVQLMANTEIKDDFTRDKYSSVQKFVKSIKHQKNANSFYNFFKKADSIKLDFIGEKDLIHLWSEIDFDKIKNMTDLDMIGKYLKNLAKPNTPTHYNLDHPWLKDFGIEGYSFHLPENFHELAYFGHELRNCIADKETQNQVVGAVKKDGQFYAALRFGKSFEFRLKANKNTPKELYKIVFEKTSSLTKEELEEFWVSIPEENADEGSQETEAVLE